jgi:hypothetical protein
MLINTIVSLILASPILAATNTFIINPSGVLTETKPCSVDWVTSNFDFQSTIQLTGTNLDSKVC